MCVRLPPGKFPSEISRLNSIVPPETIFNIEFIFGISLQRIFDTGWRPLWDLYGLGSAAREVARMGAIFHLFLAGGNGRSISFLGNPKTIPGIPGTQVPPRSDFPFRYFCERPPIRAESLNSGKYDVGSEYIPLLPKGRITSPL